jgi:hypothetical protein
MEEAFHYICKTMFLWHETSWQSFFVYLSGYHHLDDDTNKTLEANNYQIFENMCRANFKLKVLFNKFHRGINLPTLFLSTFTKSTILNTIKPFSVYENSSLGGLNGQTSKNLSWVATLRPKVSKYWGYRVDYPKNTRGQNFSSLGLIVQAVGVAEIFVHGGGAWQTDIFYCFFHVF